MAEQVRGRRHFEERFGARSKVIEPEIPSIFGGRYAGQRSSSTLTNMGLGGWGNDAPKPSQKTAFGRSNPTNAGLYRQDMRNVPLHGFEQYGPRFAGLKNASQLGNDGDRLIPVVGPYSRAQGATRVHPTTVPRLHRSGGPHATTLGDQVPVRLEREFGRKIRVPDTRNGIPVANLGDLPYKHSHEEKGYYLNAGKAVLPPNLVRFIEGLPKRPVSAPEAIHEAGIIRREALKMEQEKAAVTALTAWAPNGMADEDDEDDIDDDKGDDKDDDNAEGV